MSNSESRYDLVSRRALLKRSLLVGTLVFAPGLACSSSDKSVFATDTSTTLKPGGATPTSTTMAQASGATASTTTAKAGGTTGSTTTAPAAGGAPFPSGGQLTVRFSFTPSAAGGRVNNPYVAVWIEDASGALVRTVSLWYKAAESKYVQELRRWYTVDRARIAKGGTDTMRTISGATRVAGAYSVTWDGKNDAGALVAQGEYFICIEAAREHGPYELIREPITIGAKAFERQLTDNGELTAASVALVV